MGNAAVQCKGLSAAVNGATEPGNFRLQVRLRSTGAAFSPRTRQVPARPRATVATVAPMTVYNTAAGAKTQSSVIACLTTKYEATVPAKAAKSPVAAPSTAYSKP